MADETQKERLIPINEGFTPINIDKYTEREKASATPEYWEYRRKWSENPRNFIVDKGPIHIDIEVTNACNLKCPMCLRTKQNENGKCYEKIGFMDFELYKKIIDEASDIGVSSVKLFWRGEPLMDSSIVQKVKYAKEKGIIDVAITTNATLLTEKLSRELIEAGLDKLGFSFDSPYKDKYESIRVGANFDKTFNNIRRFSEIRDEMKSITPLIRALLVKINADDKEVLAYDSLFSEILDETFYRDEIHYDIEVDSELLSISNMELLNFSCPLPWQRLSVTWDGNYSPCCCYYGLESELGNAKQSTVYEIWNNEKMNFIRNAHMNNTWVDIEYCKKCQICNMVSGKIEDIRKTGKADGYV